MVGVMEEEYISRGIEMYSNNFGPRGFDSQEHWNQNTFETSAFNTLYTHPFPMLKTEED